MDAIFCTIFLDEFQTPKTTPNVRRTPRERKRNHKLNQNPNSTMPSRSQSIKSLGSMESDSASAQDKPFLATRTKIRK